ncbi:MAG: LysR family transcriptional regulator [Deltaproteobacteria bacterium]|nr:LysR family transcriptional regulator [Deltaproteobacteria bacterium]
MALPVTLDQLEVFVAVAHAGGFAEAARELSRTQSAVSKAVANMERLLDVALFERSARGTSLTASGAMLLASAKEVLRSADAFASETSRVLSGTEGVVSVAVDALCPTAPVLAALATMTERFPQTAVVVRTEQLALLPRLVLSGTCAMGVCGPQGIEHRDLDVRYLRTTVMLPVCAASHPLAEAMASQGRVRREQLAAQTHLYLTERADWLDAEPPAPGEGVAERRWWKLSDLGTKHQCLRSGLGWGMMPQHLVAAELERGALVQLRVEGLREQWTHTQHLVCRRDTQRGPAVELLHRTLQQNLQSSANSEQSAGYSERS